MFRLILLLLAMAAPAGAQPLPQTSPLSQASPRTSSLPVGSLLPQAAPLPEASPLHVSATFAAAGPAAARGALVWLHGTYDPAANGPPQEPDIVARLAAGGFDVWRFDRTHGQDALDASAAGLTRGLQALRRAGYRRVLVAGHSRGGWIALRMLAHPGLADVVVAISPAAFGTRPERQQEAMADWSVMWRAAGPAATRVVLVQLRDDPYDPNPAARLRIAQTESRRAGLRLLSVFLPDRPTGHIGAYMPDFDVLLGAQVAAFVNATNPDAAPHDAGAP